jgi:NAD(P)-dependent dehydrogenase (short-subunit alcohol dehydrogenase family)
LITGGSSGIGFEITRQLGDFNYATSHTMVNDYTSNVCH